MSRFTKKCQSGIINPLVVTPSGTIVDGLRRWLGAVYWNIRSVPCKIISRDLSPPELCSLAIFLNDRRPSRVGEKLAMECPITLSWGTEEERINHTQMMLARRSNSEAVMARTTKREHSRIDDILPAALAKAINTVRELDFFCDHFDEPPEAATKARELAGEAAMQLIRILPSCSGIVRPRIAELVASDSGGLSQTE